MCTCGTTALAVQGRLVVAAAVHTSQQRVA
eukprot:COSAG03_NODE_25375_length_266_cov_0.610778_1_plen_29_part_01